MAHRDYIVHRGIYFQGVGGGFLIAGLWSVWLVLRDATENFYPLYLYRREKEIFFRVLLPGYLDIFFSIVDSLENFMYIFDFLISYGVIRHIFNPHVLNTRQV